VRKKPDVGSSSLSRREFGKRFALVTGAGIVPSAPVVAAPVDSRAPGSPLDQNDPALQKLSAEGRLRFDLMWQNILRKYGDRLTDEQKSRMRKIVVTNVTMLESIYAVPLKNGDAPATSLLLLDDNAARRRVGPASRRAARRTGTNRKSAGRNN
jgi:hypothetical protein